MCSWRQIVLEGAKFWKRSDEKTEEDAGDGGIFESFVCAETYSTLTKLPEKGFSVTIIINLQGYTSRQ